MCELPGPKLQQATDAELISEYTRKSTAFVLDSLFGPALRRAEEQSRKIEWAAKLCREVDEEDPWSTQA